jgi:predicted Zn-dependent protease
VPFRGGPADPRDYALAYSIVRPATPRSDELLRKAEAANPGDLAVMSQLAATEGGLRRRRGLQDLPDWWERILRLDRWNPVATANLAIHRMKADRKEEAVQLWEGSLRANPGQIGVRMNLAEAYCDMEDYEACERQLSELVRFEPELDAGWQMLDSIRDLKG